MARGSPAGSPRPASHWCTRVDLELHTDPAGWVIAGVTDDGVGFDVTAVLRRAVNDGHLGLHSMLERVEMAGGLGGRSRRPWAAGGRPGRRRQVRLRPDVVVMDIRMPDMPGPEATAWLASRCPGVRVVGLTAYDDEALHDAMARAGATSVLVKGASIRQIVGAIAGAAPG
jgi:CheY-like chemotaxis protein